MSGGAWAWHAHPVVWVVVAAAFAFVVLLHRRNLRTDPQASRWERRRVRRFVGSLLLVIAAMGWPLGDLAANWSLAALVVQRCVLVLAVAPMILTGLPDDVIWRATRPAPVDAVLVRLVRPPAAVICVTVLLVGSMAPALVAAQSRSGAARGAVAVVVAVAGLVLWLPIIGRVPGIARPRPMIRAVYLVVQAVVPVFLSFIYILATRPLYPAFARSEGAIGLAPLNDQQVAGFVSKLSFLIALLVVAGSILAHAPDSDEDLGPADPLVWADVERQFERLDRSGRPTHEPPASAPGPREAGYSRPDAYDESDPATGIPGDVDSPRDPEPGSG